MENAWVTIKDAIEFVRNLGFEVFGIREGSFMASKEGLDGMEAYHELTDYCHKHNLYKKFAMVEICETYFRMVI